MIYLDNASTTFPKPATVAAAMQRFLSEVGASPGRGAYAAAITTERIISDVRRVLTRMIGGDDPSRMIFTGSCTDSLNLAIHGVLREGDHVVTTTVEHNSVSRPLETLRQRGFITLTRVPFGADGRVDPDAVAAALQPNTRLVTLNHASNVTGAIQPAAAIGPVVRRHGAYLLLDAAQTAGLLNIDLDAWCVDLLAFPAHKEMLGPPGLGLLYVGPGVDIAPLRQGGTGGDSAHPVQPEDWPHRLETGTPNTVGIAGLQAALKELAPEATLARLRARCARLLKGLAGHERIHHVGGAGVDACVGTLSLTIDGLGVEDAAAILDESFGIAVRAGLHCAPYAHQTLGTFPDGTIRISPGPYTTETEIDRAIEALVEIAASV